MSQTDTTALLASIVNLVKTELAPLASAIDQEGVYPADFLHQLGALGFILDGLAQKLYQHWVRNPGKA